jgi:hypothetical protein
LNSLVEILQESGEKELKDQFTILALENIRTENTFFSSIIFLRKILNTYPQDSRYKTGGTAPTIQSILIEIFKKYELFNLIFLNTNIYLHQALQIKQAKFSTLAEDKLQA